ncbi:hypothetical protein [Streptomyces sp. MUM 2J]|uniref:hypothetical protein n=1 Tax=Streptomyces sp. MUM 2J TaxID=2791987 RepID=UPI001F03925C|nr:hypothetical protein [Streptomyces sp. MUM 2J]MCH0562176.1 hypothetical protein [Streptomyces sp. MUM 2J]
MAAARKLAETVFVNDPKANGTLVLTAGTEISDPAVIQQITHPDAWEPMVEVPQNTVSKSAPPARRSKSVAP